MEGKKNILTYEGLKKYEDELHDLKVVRRKEVAQKIKDKVFDEDTRLFVQSKVRLVGDILTWPISMISSFT